MSQIKKISNFSDTINLFGDIFEGNQTQLSIDHIEKIVYSAYHIQGREIKFIIPRTYGRYMLLNTLRFWFKLQIETTAQGNFYFNPAFAFERVEVSLNSQNVLSLYNQYHGRSHQLLKFLKYERDHRLYCNSERIYNMDNGDENNKMIVIANAQAVGVYNVDFTYKIDTSLLDLDKILLDNIEIEITFYVPSGFANRCLYSGTGTINENNTVFTKAMLSFDSVIPTDNLKNYLINGVERSPVPYDIYLIHAYRYVDQPAGNNNIENCYINNRWPSYCIISVLPTTYDNYNLNNADKWSNYTYISNLQLTIKGINYPNRMITIEDTTNCIGSSFYYEYLKSAFPNNSFDFKPLYQNMIYVFDLENTEYYDPEENVDVNIQYNNIHTANLNIYIFFLTKHQILIDKDRNVTII